MKLTTPALFTLVFLVTVAFVFAWCVGNYNSLVTSKAQVEKSWSKVETRYQRRLDLIGNLVESVKGAQGQEQKVFGDIAKARSAYGNATNSADKAAAASSMETNIALIPRLQEAYPELKSNQQVTALMTQLAGTEDDILGARDEYNSTTTNYNVNIQSFPKSIFANWFGFTKQPLFKSEKGSEKAPKVKF